MHPILILVVVIAVLLTVSWLKRLPPQQRQRAGFRAALIAGGALLLLALVTGRLNPLVALVAAAIPVLQRLMVAKQVFDRFRSASGPSVGRTSKVGTAYLDMHLDHDTGEMTGTVLQGRFRGRTLGALSLDDLLELLAECRAQDAQSAAVLEAYLDRTHGDDWREREPGDAGARAHAAGDAAMSVEEARQILGVEDGASDEEIVAAHRRLMQKLHPDRGGTTYLAAKINQAKDLLLARG